MAVDRGQILGGVVAVLAAAAGGGLLASGASAAGLSSESPQQVMQAASSAIRGAKGYELRFVERQPSGGAESAYIVNGGHGDLDMTIAESSQGTARIILVGSRSYMRASVLFWDKHGSTESLAKVLAPDWYKVPRSEFSGLTRGLGDISASTFARCLGQDHGPLSNLGSATVDRQAAVVLKDAGGKPGTAPETLAVAATGKPFPLRITVTGPTLAGGPVNSCNDGKADKSIGSITLSHWNSAPAVKAPAHAVDLPSN